jgi:hypothetical protein
LHSLLTVPLVHQVRDISLSLGVANKVPFASPLMILTYWNFHPHTSKLIANHCRFDSILQRVEQLNAVNPAEFTHGQNTGTEYRRLVNVMTPKFLALPAAARADGTVTDLNAW